MKQSLRQSSFLWLLPAVFVIFLLFFNYSSAQTFGEISLTSSPKTPEPYGTVSVSLGQYGVDTFGSEVYWYVNNVEQTDYRNERVLEYVVGGLGERSAVRVVVNSKSGASLSADLVFSPTVVDIILEANTYIPDFYLGRALPSSESEVRAIAVVNGGGGSSLDYVYKWSLGSTVLFGGPVRGKNVAEFLMPRSSNRYLSVEVVDKSGALVSRKSIVLKPKPVELYFYEDNPLRGLQEKAVNETLYLLGRETTIFGEPYYIHPTPLSDGGTFEWTIDSRKTAANPLPNSITLQSVGDTGSATIGLEVISKNKIPLYVEKAFKVLFQ